MGFLLAEARATQVSDESHLLSRLGGSTWLGSARPDDDDDDHDGRRLSGLSNNLLLPLGSLRFAAAAAASD